jgi:molybdate transport system substrate-binding protein
MEENNVRKILLTLGFLICAVYLTSCTQKSQQIEGNAKSITICAAVSLREALNEIKPKFEQEKSIKLTFNFGSSGTLQKQIQEGAPADVFISAGKKQMDALESRDFIIKESRKNLLSNELVLIVPKEYTGKIKTVDDLSSSNMKVCIGEPQTVPAGQYAKEALTNLNLWNKLSASMVYAKDVKQVVAYVEKGEVAGGIVYNSDATSIKDSEVVQVFDESTHNPIVYPEAIVSSSKDKESAKAFLDYLNTDSAKQVFEKYGFSVIDGI